MSILGILSFIFLIFSAHILIHVYHKINISKILKYNICMTGLTLLSLIPIIYQGLGYWNLIQGIIF